MTTPAVPSCFVAFSAIPILLLKFYIFYYTSLYKELTLYAGVLYIQPSWYSFSSWPHIDITPLGRYTFLASPFSAEMFLDRYICIYKVFQATLKFFFAFT